jgi:3-oxoacyl-[acyl-carrier-protein] synthase-1
MSARPLEIFSPGMVSSVGLSSAATCAAVRAGLTNPTPTRFTGPDGGYMMAHAVPLEDAWRGIQRLARMAAMSMEEALRGVAVDEWSKIPVILCVAEQTRVGRIEGLEDELLDRVQKLLGARFASESLIVPQGRVSAAVALLYARRFLYEKAAPMVLVAAVDSLLTWPTLRSLIGQDRLLTTTNSNGFIPGEGASAVLVRKPDGNAALICRGLGFATEAAQLDSEQPLKADGLTSAIKKSLGDAGCELHDLDFRIGDMAGEQYFFKEAALALGRVLRQRKETFDLWHPADCIGETGANIGIACLAIAHASSQLKYAPGRGVLLHASADSGERAAIVAFGAS